MRNAVDRRILADSGRRRGGTALEFTILLSLFLLLVFGMSEFGRAIMVRQILVNAAREGTRRAVVPGANDAEVQAIVDGYMYSAGVGETGSPVHTQTIHVNKGTWSEASLATASSHDAIAVTVSVPYSQVSWTLPWHWISSDAQLWARAVMRKE
jgi:Flp pilus assembly protein TadG